MNKGLLNEVIMKRKKRRASMDMDEKEDDEDCATPGLDSEDLEEVDAVILGDGVKKETLHKSHGRTSSTDDLSPSKQEMQAKSIDGVKKKKDDEKDKDNEVFDESAYASTKNRKPNSIYERMMQGLGKKLNK